ncbi:MAG: hypothetical protein Kow00127_24070 [Bacteroidales bacterium]
MQRIIILTSVILLFQLSVAAQHATGYPEKARIDTLENKLLNSLSYNLTSSEKYEICTELAQLYSDTDFRRSLEYAARALLLADEEGNNRKIAHSLQLLTDINHQNDQYEQAIEYATRLFNLYNSNHQELEAGIALQTIASCYYDWSRYVEAKDNYTRAMAYFKKLNNYSLIARTQIDIARIHAHWGEYDEALRQYQDALSFYEEMNDREGIARAHTGIGTIYKELGQLDPAFDHYRKSLEIYKETGDKINIVNLTLHIGDVYLRKELYDKALEYYFQARELGRDLNHNKLKAITLSNIGEAYNKKGDYVKALDFQLRSLKIKQEIGDKMRLAVSYAELGSIYYHLGETGKAIENLETGLQLAREINFRYQINQIEKQLAEVCYAAGNYLQAFDHQQKYMEGRERLLSEESRRTVEELRAKYHLEKQEKENEILRHNEQLAQTRIRLQQIVIMVVFVSLLVLIYFAFVLYKRYQQNKKLTVELSISNKELDEQRKNIENLNRELQEANRTKDKFFQIVAHDLKNPFNALIALSSLLIEDYDSFTDEERKQFIAQINQSAESTFSLLQNLLEWARAQSGHTKIRKEKVDLSEVAQEALKVLEAVAKGKRINIISEIKPGTTVWADRNMVSTVLLNLISNAVKFTHTNGEVKLSAVTVNGLVEVVVSDNGTGIPEKNLKRLFKPDERVITKGTNNEKGTGLGLLLCKEFIERNGGTIRATSRLNKGSAFSFNLPAKETSTVVNS